MQRAGFSLIELLLVLAIAAIVMSIAIPSYRFLVVENRTAVHVNQLVSAIHFARSEAIYRHTVVSLCKSKDGETCSGQWKDGWIVFVDPSAAGRLTITDQILRVYAAIPPDSDLEWTGQRSNDYLQMDATGTTRGQAGTFRYIPDVKHPEKYSEIIVSQTGRIRIEDIK